MIRDFHEIKRRAKAIYLLSFNYPMEKYSPVEEMFVYLERLVEENIISEDIEDLIMEKIGEECANMTKYDIDNLRLAEL